MRWTRTIRFADGDAQGVLYEVMDGTVCIWQRKVAFGQEARHRAGGHAFREAALEQECVRAQGD